MLTLAAEAGGFGNEGLEWSALMVAPSRWKAIVVASNVALHLATQSSPIEKDGLSFESREGGRRERSVVGWEGRGRPLVFRAHGGVVGEADGNGKCCGTGQGSPPAVVGNEGAEDAGKIGAHAVGWATDASARERWSMLGEAQQ